MKAPSHDLMNSLTRSVLTLASYDDDIDKTDLQTQLEQCIKLISVFPMLAVYATTPTIIMSAAAACTSTARTRAFPRRKTC